MFILWVALASGLNLLVALRQTGTGGAKWAHSVFSA